MKHRQLQAIAHNLADSIASGCSLLIGGAYALDVFGDAARSEGGAITIDFLTGKILEGDPSLDLSNTVSKAPKAVAKLCGGCGTSPDAFRELTARFWSDYTGPRFATTVEDSAGRRSTIEFAGIPGRRVQIIDSLGRRRPKPSRG